jgi:hypothetical protein
MDSHLYKRLGLDRQGIMIYKHRLIMEKHLGGPLSPREVVHHINGDIQDNRLENLEVTTASAHVTSHNNKLNSLSVQTIRELEKEGCPRQKIADRFKVTTAAIGHVINGHTWAHIN